MTTLYGLNPSQWQLRIIWDLSPPLPPLQVTIGGCCVMIDTSHGKVSWSVTWCPHMHEMIHRVTYLRKGRTGTRRRRQQKEEKNLR